MSSEISSLRLSSSSFQNTQLAKTIFPKLVCHWYRKHSVRHLKKDLHTWQMQIVGWLTHKQKQVCTNTHACTYAYAQYNFSSCIWMEMIDLVKLSGCNYLQIKNVKKIDYILCSRHDYSSRCSKMISSGNSLCHIQISALGVGERVKNRWFLFNLVVWWLKCTSLCGLDWGMSKLQLPQFEAEANAEWYNAI